MSEGPDQPLVVPPCLSLSGKLVPLSSLLFLFDLSYVMFCYVDILSGLLFIWIWKSDKQLTLVPSALWLNITSNNWNSITVLRVPGWVVYRALCSAGLQGIFKGTDLALPGWTIMYGIHNMSCPQLRATAIAQWPWLWLWHACFYTNVVILATMQLWMCGNSDVFCYWRWFFVVKLYIFIY